MKGSAFADIMMRVKLVESATFVYHENLEGEVKWRERPAGVIGRPVPAHGPHSSTLRRIGAPILHSSIYIQLRYLAMVLMLTKCIAAGHHDGSNRQQQAAEDVERHANQHCCTGIWRSRTASISSAGGGSNYWRTRQR